ncbi:uncharacterized protein LOC111241889 [Vigna radiata var. radiata]|uniref:Uncharacterized protein LOC111241889 n=1 Tax=Vigna radiata var. radiata TaxID=3916 RepID=A0A3Q0F2L2_VIGRR|nr:uncharacterized protein LOC111241889 [Vigna radiata var. radiata]
MSKNFSAFAIQPMGSVPSKVGSSTCFVQLRCTSLRSSSDSSSELSDNRRSRWPLMELRPAAELRFGSWSVARKLVGTQESSPAPPPSTLPLSTLLPPFVPPFFSATASSEQIRQGSLSPSSHQTELHPPTYPPISFYL